MKPLSKDWYMFTAGFIWAFVCGALLSCGVFSWSFSRSLDSVIEKKCPDPAVEMAEYKTVVRSLDRCNERLHEDGDLLYNMRDYVDHWDYISRLADSVDDTTKVMILINKATEEFRMEAEEDLYACQSIREEECWCP